MYDAGVYAIKSDMSSWEFAWLGVAGGSTRPNVCQNQFRVSAPRLNFYHRRGSSREFGPRLFEVQIKAYALLLALITAAHSTPRPRPPPPPLAAALSNRDRRRVKLRCVVVSLQV